MYRYRTEVQRWQHHPGAHNGVQLRHKIRHLRGPPPGTQIETLVLNPDATGFTYEAKYGFLGANGLGMPIVFDGMNTEGLYFGAFYFSGEAVYAKLTTENRHRAVSSDEMGNWVLGQFATVEEVKAALPSIDVVGTYVKEIDGFAPFHYAVTDASGASIVIEYTAEGLRVFDNTVNAVLPTTQPLTGT